MARIEYLARGFLFVVSFFALILFPETAALRRIFKILTTLDEGKKALHMACSMVICPEGGSELFRMLYGFFSSRK